jgi:glucokinase
VVPHLLFFPAIPLPVQIIGIDIGGTKCAVSVLRGGTVEEVDRFPTQDHAATLARFRKTVGSLQPGPEVVFGISCGGPLDAKRGVILSPPNLPGWVDIAICREFTDTFGGRAYLMNDANASALAEWHFGAGKGCQHMVFLTAGTGMGAGLILNGRLYEGATGDAGEVGHLRLRPDGPLGFGKRGSFEGFCSGGGIARLAAEMGWQPAGATLKDIAEAAGKGDGLALKVMDTAGERLGEALALLIDTLNPERIVLGGYFPRCSQLLVPSMHRALKAEALASALAGCEIVPAVLGETIGSNAAVAVALHALDTLPGKTN